VSISEVSIVMGCWRWFSSVLKEAGVTVTPQNRARIDKVIHEYIGAKAEYEHCSSDWMKSGKNIKMDAKERGKLIKALKSSLA